MKCRYCAREAEPNRTMCTEHLAYRRRAAQKYRAKKLGAGLCISCGHNPLDTEIYCKICKVLTRKIRDFSPCQICKVLGHVRIDHKAIGLCWYCPLEAMPDSNLCEVHHNERQERRRKKAQEYREKWKKTGRCLICGAPAVNQSRCQRHREYAAQWEREHRIRL